MRVTGHSASLWQTALHGLRPRRANEEKVDYREVLDERSFAVFARLRNIRKQMAAEAAVPAYAIFTDAELADIAQLETLDEASLGQLQGIGTKRVEKYGREMLQRYYTEGQMT